MTWKRSKEQEEFRANLRADFICGLEGPDGEPCKMVRFNARVVDGDRRMKEHRRKAHPERKEPPSKRYRKRSTA